VLHPSQFQVNEAWIAFRLNDALIHTELDGDFNCLALMDAASCYILGNALVSANEAHPTQMEVRRLLKSGRAREQAFPKTLFVPSEVSVNNLVLEAERNRIAVVRVSEHQLQPFIGEAQEGYRERFGGGARSEA